MSDCGQCGKPVCDCYMDVGYEQTIPAEKQVAALLRAYSDKTLETSRSPDKHHERQ